MPCRFYPPTGMFDDVVDENRPVAVFVLERKFYIVNCSWGMIVSQVSWSQVRQLALNSDVQRGKLQLGQLGV